ncbi:hypothetical protein E4U60_004279 [Claviceps pazoutovae]|uniref:Uncharacterized protein n=1 Tax=Claviceps pazoutovae TaxID=1649127 RepID=A0A9P7M8V6_9HYPO|nr:hypothetical protein E4U60_004279 [Claviceps pazoutovae]
MKTHRLALPALSASRVCTGTRASTASLGGIRFSSTGPLSVADPAFWKSLIPKPFRKENRKHGKGKKSKEWNPATFFINMFILIGSMPIQMIALRKQSKEYDRQSSLKIARLHETLRRLRNGGEADGDEILGGADEAQKDLDWAELLRAAGSESMHRGAESATLTAAQDTTTTTKQPLMKDQDEPSTTKPKSSTLGNFF